MSIARAFNVEDVASEFFAMGARGKAANTMQIAWVHGLVNVALNEAGFPAPLYIPPPTVKKWWTGSGKAEKPELLEAAKRELAWNVDAHDSDDNVIDASFIVHMLDAWYAWKAGQSTETDPYRLEAMPKWTRAIGD